MTEEPGTRDEVLDRDQPFFCRACSGTGKKSNVEGNTQETDCDVCGGTGEQPEGRSEFAEPERVSTPEALDNRDMKEADADNEPVAPSRIKSLAGEIAKMEHDPAELNAVRQGLIALIKAELDEMAAGVENETDDVAELLHALCAFLCWWDEEADENETVEPFTQSEDNDNTGDTMAYVGLGVSADLIKNASAETATPEVKSELRSEIVKALGLEEVMTAKAELSKATEEIELLKAALDEVKSMAAPGGPALRATREQTSKSAATLAREVEAQRFRNLAAQITDPALRNQYLDTARALEAN